jgi:hypothetical protein
MTKRIGNNREYWIVRYYQRSITGKRFLSADEAIQFAIKKAQNNDVHSVRHISEEDIEVEDNDGD